MRNIKYYTIDSPHSLYTSASRIRLYQTCKRCYYLKYILNTPETDDNDWLYDYGNKVHHTIESMIDWLGVTYNKQDLGDKYQSYLTHIKDMKKFIKNKIISTEVEFYYQWDNPLPIFWFFDGVIFEKKSKYWKPVAVKIDWDNILRYFVDHNNQTQKIKSKKGYAGDVKIVWLMEIKTSSSKWSHNSIMTNTQFAIYNHIKNVIAWDINFFLLSLSTWQNLQQFLIRTPELQYERVQAIIKEIENNKERPSQCWYGSPYQSICKDFTF